VAYRVILGDPSYSAQKAVQTAFPESEFEVYPFDNGQDVLDNIVRVQPDAVLLSLSLPGRDGYEVGRLLRNLESYKRVPLIFLKGVFEHLDPEKGAWIAEEDIVQKPFDSEKLAAFVREAIEKTTSPATFPEEPLFENTAEFKPQPKRDEEVARGRFPEDSPPDLKKPFPGPRLEDGELDLKIRDSVRKEILEAEREIEKRVRARVLAEVRMFLDERLEELKTKD